VGEGKCAPGSRLSVHVADSLYSIRITLGLILLRISSAESVFLSAIRCQTAETVI
jgi:hypothetical protein